MSRFGPHIAPLVTINTPAATENVGSYPILPSTSGIAKKLYNGTNTSRTLASIQVFVKPFINDTTEPVAPTATEWDGDPAHMPPIQPSGVVPPSNIQFDTVYQEYHWFTGGFPVRTAGNGKNKIWVRAKWVVDPSPANGYQYTFESDPTDKVFVATASHLATGVEATSLAAPAAFAPSTNPDDILPDCRDGDWLLYKNIPASTLDKGVRLMVNESTPLRAFELAIAAAEVRWDLASQLGRYLGIRRACGSDMGCDPTASTLAFRYKSLPRWSIVMDQEPSAPWIPNPFVVMSHSRCHPDIAVINPNADVYLRINYPSLLYRAVQGSYSLWVNPSLGIAKCNIPSCSGDSCSPV